MNITLKFPLIAAVASVTLALSTGVSAGGGHYDGYGYYGKHGHSHRYYEPPRHYGHRSHHNHNNGDDDEELVVGLLLGGLVGYAIGNARPDPRPYDSYPPVAAPPPAASWPPPASYPAPAPSYGGTDTCLQEREYQTRVMIGGREVDAYGTACLQPDGSWRRGPAQTAAYSY